MAFCLLREDADRFREALRKGEVDPERMSEMTSKERHEMLSKIIGKDNATDVNALFESKLLLKNQQAGYVSWAKKVLGMSPVAKRDLISRIEKLDKVLDPAEEKAFLNDLAEKKLGVGVSFEEASKITELSQKVKDAREAMEASTRRETNGNQTPEEKAYGDAANELNTYVSDLKNAAKKITFADFKQRPVQTLAKGIAAAPGFTKSIQAAFDNSSLFRQGWKTMWTNPVIWQRNARKSFVDIYRTFGGKDVAAELNSDILSRPNYETYKKMKLDVGNMEEAFPSTLPEKIPFIRRAYKASENAYTGFLHKTRADVADKYLDIARKNGAELTDKELVNIGRLVNSLTGRGYLGHAERALSTINTIFFSPRNLKAHIDTLTQPLSGGATFKEVAQGENSGSNFVRKEAFKNLIKTAAGITTVLVAANALKPGSVEDDPTSADFGKIKVGNTRFDVTGGMGSLLVLLSRLATGKSKSSVSGKVTDLRNPKFGESNGLDVIEDFFMNKLSPMMSVAKDFIKGETFEGKKPTVSGEALQLITPLPVKTLTELLKDPEAKKDPRFIAFAQAMDMLGMSVNTYTKRPKGAKEPDLDLGKLLQVLTGEKEPEPKPMTPVVPPVRDKVTRPNVKR